MMTRDDRGRVREVLRRVPVAVFVALLIGVDQILIRFPVLFLATSVMGFAVPMAAGGLAAARLGSRTPDARLGKLLAVGALWGVIAAMIQTGLRFGLPDVVFTPVWGAMMGPVGVLAYMVSERAPKRRQDPAREHQMRRMLRSAGGEDPDDD